MSPDERQMLTGLFQRISAQGGAPRDRDAEALIADAVRSMPFAPYLLAQAVLVQEQALGAANTRLQELEAQVRDLQSRPAQADAGSGGFLGGLGKSLFGGSAAPAPRPQQNYAPQQPSGPWGQPAPQAYQQPQQNYQPAPQYQQPAPRGGGGFMTGALGAAAGIAGGVLMADSNKGLFGGHGNPLGNTAGSMLGGHQTDYQPVLADADAAQDELQDANDYASGNAAADYAADTSDSGGGSDDSGSTDV